MENKFDFTGLLEKVKNKSINEIIQEAYNEIEYVDKLTLNKDERNKRLKYKRVVKELIFFLENGIKPSSIEPWNWKYYKGLVINLVEKGQLKSTILDLFND